MRTASGSDEVISLKLCYSTKAPHLELVEERPGTPWTCNEYSNLHHIGFFSDSLVERRATDSKRARAPSRSVAVPARKRRGCFRIIAIPSA